MCSTRRWHAARNALKRRATGQVCVRLRRQRVGEVGFATRESARREVRVNASDDCWERPAGMCRQDAHQRLAVSRLSVCALCMSCAWPCTPTLCLVVCPCPLALPASSTCLQVGYLSDLPATALLSSTAKRRASRSLVLLAARHPFQAFSKHQARGDSSVGNRLPVYAHNGQCALAFAAH